MLNEMTLRVTLLDLIELNREMMKMDKGVDSIQDAGNGQLNGATTDLSSFTTILQAIFAEGADYTKKLVETRLALGEKLLGAKSFETVIQIQDGICQDGVRRLRRAGDQNGRTPFQPRQDSLQAGWTGVRRHARHHARHEVIGR